MITIQITQSCLIRGEHVEAGTILANVAGSTAADLIAAGKATTIPDQGQAIEVREPVVENRDPKPKRASKAK
jgi:hypothetical protein